MRRYKKPKKNVFPTLILLLSVGLIFISFIIIFIKVSTLDKFFYVNNKDGNAELIIIDAKSDSYIKMLIDKDLEVSSSRNYGQYKIGSLWLLSEKNKMGGQLVSESILKNFSVPVYLWKNKQDTNLNIFQRIKSSFVEKSLTDYYLEIKTVDTSDNVLIKFVDTDSSDESLILEISDLTGSLGLAEKISKILGIFNVKTASYSKGYQEDLDCLIGGKNQKLVNLVGRLFSCKDDLDDGGYDLRIKIGKLFADRF